MFYTIIILKINTLIILYNIMLIMNVHCLTPEQDDIATKNLNIYTQLINAL